MNFRTNILVVKLIFSGINARVTQKTQKIKDLIKLL